MRILLAFLILTFAASVDAGGPPDRVVIHLLDPRGAIAGDQTMSTEWNNGKTDVIGTRLLNIAEARKLRSLLRKELANDDNIPFCGHSPAYAVAVTSADKTTITVTLCGTCGTWAKQGDLRALHGNASLEYLDTLLPLPDVFRPVAGKPKQVLKPFAGGKKIPFQQLDDPDSE